MKYFLFIILITAGMPHTYAGPVEKVPSSSSPGRLGSPTNSHEHLLASPSTSASASASEVATFLQLSLRNHRPLPQILETLQQRFGTHAIPSLLEIAKDASAADDLRWTAIYGLGRLAGRASAGVLRSFLRDPHWLIRDAALKTAAALHATELSTDIAARLHDDALIVRTTAVQTIGHLALVDQTPKLLVALNDTKNYNQGKGLWIHKHILKVLNDFHYQAAVPHLERVLRGSASQDQSLQREILASIQQLKQTKLNPISH